MAYYLVAAIGNDRPGIVAAVVRALADLGCNLEDSQMALLRGEFLMALVVSAPSTVSGGGLEVALASVGAELDLAITVRSVSDPSGARRSAGELRAITVRGADRVGIVAAITTVLAEAGANVAELTTHVREGAATMRIVTALASADDEAALVSRLEAAASDLGVSCRVHAVATPWP